MEKENHIDDIQKQIDSLCNQKLQPETEAKVQGRLSQLTPEQQEIVKAKALLEAYKEVMGLK
ncbi:MAG: hypothetical protein LIP09_16620 [Bacteroidales bacterium]|nr:hypothetical protein [Bacteroidales bacterium]